MREKEAGACFLCCFRKAMRRVISLFLAVFLSPAFRMASVSVERIMENQFKAANQCSCV